MKKCSLGKALVYWLVVILAIVALAIALMPEQPVQANGAGSHLSLDDVKKLSFHFKCELVPGGTLQNRLNEQYQRGWVFVDAVPYKLSSQKAGSIANLQVTTYAVVYRSIPPKPAR